MNNWSFEREEGSRLSPGDYRVEIVEVEETVSKAGNPMIVVTVKPNGSSIKIKHYIVRNEWFNRNMTDFYDGFPQIDEGDFNFLGWIGCVGAARLKEDDRGYLKVHYFLNAQQAEALPEWQGEMPERQTVADLQGLADIDDSDGELPF